MEKLKGYLQCDGCLKSFPKKEMHIFDNVRRYYLPGGQDACCKECFIKYELAYATRYGRRE